MKVIVPARGEQRSRTQQEGAEQPAERDCASEQLLYYSLRQLLPRASEEQLETLLQSMRCLMEESEAGRERRAIMSLLMRHDAVPASELQRLCSREVEARIAEMREARIPI